MRVLGNVCGYTGMPVRQTDMFLVKSCMRFWRNLYIYRYWLLFPYVDLITSSMIVALNFYLVLLVFL